jgi:BirA family biotin operon repressor/biotin-[acetyl-CoA-carboxylase] ligase
MTALYDGLDPTALARRWSLPRVLVLQQTTSTMDEAHALAARGAAAGTLVIAHVQTAGRGRSGGAWVAVEGASILCTLIERPRHTSALDVLSLRVGLGVAASLDPFAPSPVGVKWPNDLIVGGGKVAGVLVEARWRDSRLEWVAIAIGINVGAAPSQHGTARALRAGVARLMVLDAVLGALRGAAAREGPLTHAELAAWTARDRLAGKRITAPVEATVRGVLPTGELALETPNGVAALRSGSVTLAEGETL